MLILRFSDKQSLRRCVGSDERKSLTAEAAEFSKEAYEEPSSPLFGTKLGGIHRRLRIVAQRSGFAVPMPARAR
jgi:hypothetical protein